MLVEREVVLKNKYGLHARPATLFAETSNGFRCDVSIVKDGQDVNGKSIFSLMMLAAECGSRLLVRATGDDAEAAVAAIEKLVESKFNEE